MKINFIHKDGNVCIQTQWKVKIENIHLFMEFKEGWTTHVQKTLKSYENVNGLYIRLVHNLGRDNCT